MRITENGCQRERLDEGITDLDERVFDVPEAMSERRRAERLKYSALYYDQHYWCEDRGVSNRPGAALYDDPDHRNRFIFLANLVSEAFSFTSLVDAGCGPGGFLAALHGEPGSKVGFDVSIEAIRRTRRAVRCRTFVADIHTIPLKSASWDLVFTSDVLEHVLPNDAEAAVRELARIARKTLVASINLDNPYEYHPTIWSRRRWAALFRAAGLRELTEAQKALQERADRYHPEYSFFCFERVSCDTP
jgi:SAM-dependent methyltransferase